MMPRAGGGLFGNLSTSRAAPGRTYAGSSPCGSKKYCVTIGSMVLKYKMKSTEDQNILLTWVEETLAARSFGLLPKDIALCRRNYSQPLARYEQRLKAIGFTGKKCVLDVCCGFGQWTLALAGLNAEVYGCDISPTRAEMVREIAAKAGIINILTTSCSLSELPYESNSFDAAFCYVSLNCTPWKESLRELARVLDYGGHLYFTANGLGYQVKQWVEQPHKSADRSPREFAAIALRNTLEYEAHGTPPESGQIITEKEEMRDCLQSLGLDILALEDEGHIDVTAGQYPPFPFFPGTYNNLTCCYEVLVAKKIKSPS